MLNDKRIESCVSRFASGAYCRLQFLRAVSHSIGAHTEALQPRDDSSSSSSSEDEDEASQTPAATTSGRRNQQRQQLHQPLTTAAKSASWRHVLASHWCRADMHGAVNLVLCACQIWLPDALFVVHR